MIESMVNQNIFLTGFMGAGKSTVGKLLADLLEFPFRDLDLMITQREDCSIAEIFSSKGERYFRDCETSLLNDLPMQPPRVYATGGGIVLRDENRQLMRMLGQIVYLRTGWPTLRNRLSLSVDRPLVDVAKGWDEVAQLWIDRQPFYADAELAIDTDQLSPLQVAQSVVAGLSS